eukprot:CAMPEP_0184521126 /NCGR_PEP_ID=MMETSP0198_2-20121128/7542_1 /TAXON_ID=1112570 /ORGANISM="Thraustochytrium sp., Strain LLF1b" /LENGTH=755 /DNA_ID=CAMNT_0026911785 /DNA_START=396 /DNA_END=2664 /DNA_ORIENTATION=+
MSDGFLSRADEIARVNAIQKENQAQLELAENEVARCDIERDLAFGYLDDLQKSKTLPLGKLIHQERSSESRCTSISRVLEQQIAASDSTSIAHAFQARASSTVHAFYKSLMGRIAYDQAYMRNQMEKTSDKVSRRAHDEARAVKMSFADLAKKHEELRRCLLGETNCEERDNVLAKVHNISAIALDAHEKALHAHEDLGSRVRRIQNKLEYFERKYNAFIARPAVRAINFFASVPTFDVSSLFINMLKSRVLPKAHSLVKDDLEDQEARVRDATVAALEHWDRGMCATETDNDLVQLEAGYAPPNEDVETPLEDFEEDSASFLKTFSKTMEKLHQDVNSSIAAAAPVVSSGASISHGVDTLDALDPRTWNVFLLEDFSFEWMSSKWDALEWVVLVCDTVFRVLNSLHIIKRYTDVSKVFVPPVDVRQFLLKRGQAIEAPKSINPLQRAALLLFHPFTGVVVGTVMMWFIVSAFLAVYVPFYERYTRGCVFQSEPQHQTGTFLSENAATFALQWATQNGDAAAAKAIERLNAMAIENCSNYTTSTSRVTQQQQSKLASYQESLLQGQENMENLGYCLRLEQSDPFLHRMVNVTTCSNFEEASFVLESAVFECNATTSCSIDCPAPNDGVIRQWTWEASCEVESFLHTALLTALLSAMIFALLNVARLLLVRGIRLVLHQELSPRHFCYIASVPLNGDELCDSEVPAPQEEVVELARQKFEASAKSHRLRGVLFCALGALAPIPGVVILHVIAQTLA